MIALIDYGIGNLRSVEKALAACVEDAIQVQVTDQADIIRQAEKIVLPGVGAFGDGMAGLRQRGLAPVIQDLAQRGIPLLGICLGMQLLFETSEELGEHYGLGLLPGRVARFPDPPKNSNGSVAWKIPHTGWNQVWACTSHPLLAGLDSQGPYAYFNHSYYCAASPATVLAETEYGLVAPTGRFASVVGQGSIYGVQFHPEKSQAVGLQILRNFLERC